MSENHSPRLYTGTEVVSALLVVILGIAFLNTDGPVWSLRFWRYLTLNAVTYTFWSAFVLAVAASVSSSKA